MVRRKAKPLLALPMGAGALQRSSTMSDTPRSHDRAKTDPPLLVGHLMASAPPQGAAATPGATLLSLALHAALLGGAVYITSLPVTREKIQETVQLITIAQEKQPDAPPPPPPPPPKMQQAAPAVVDVARGFQTLAAPTIVPPDIPPPKAGATTNEADFSGVGVEGGKANGRVGGTQTVTAEDVVAAPTFTPYTVAPELKNYDEVRRALEHAYPVMYRDAGVGGTVLVWVLIDEQGQVMKALVKKPSDMPLFNDAALKVAEIMRFSPGMNRDIKVKVWVSLPIVFKAVN